MPTSKEEILRGLE